MCPYPRNKALNGSPALWPAQSKVAEGKFGQLGLSPLESRIVLVTSLDGNI